MDKSKTPEGRYVSCKDKRRGMPSHARLRKHWAPILCKAKGYDSCEEFLEADYCFACGFLDDSGSANGAVRIPTTHRAHIKSLSSGGTNNLENIHLLCRWCHKASEGLGDRDRYWAWFYERSFMDRMLQLGASCGANIWAALQYDMQKT